MLIRLGSLLVVIARGFSRPAPADESPYVFLRALA
jgi:hypothetical protein